LEKLTKIFDQNWLDYTDINLEGEVHLGERFFKFKQETIDLRSALEKHLNNCMKSIQSGMPEVEDAGDLNKQVYSSEVLKD
jgi:hypothetical protein